MAEMDLLNKICLLMVFKVCCLALVASQTFTMGKSSDSSEKACKWPDPPRNGANFKRCGSRFCQEKPGTEKPSGFVKYTKCNAGYMMADGEEEAYCDGGSWSPGEYKCVECGRSQLNEITLIHNGKNAKQGDFPWMAGLFLRIENDQWSLKCGATLISEHIILTAAHCVKLENSTFVKPEDIQIGLGKILTEYKAESSSEFKKVREVILPQRYVGSRLNYDLDIALLDLESSVTITPNIMPACIDWENNTPLDNREGYLAGFGKTEDNVQSDVLKWSRQRYVEYLKCIEKIPAHKVRLLTPDKFCIISVQGASADHGDSGGGLTFEKEEVHYVYGIVSVRITKDVEDEDIVLFTSVLEHKEWLIEHLRRLSSLRGKHTGVNKKAALGDVCRQAGDEFWICKRESECQGLRNKLRNGIQSEACNLDSDKVRDVAVCCQPELNTPPGHSSRSKCREYAQMSSQESLLCNLFKDPIDAGLWTNVKTGEFPHWALISRDDFKNWIYANLISDRFLLSDANFLEKSRLDNNEYTKAMLGVYRPKDRSIAKEYDIAETIIHPEYKLDKWSAHNIALLRLKTSVTFGPTIRPICLHYDFVFPGTNVISTGELISDKNVILKENALIIPRKDCNFGDTPDTALICVNVDNVTEVGLLNGMPLMLRLEEPSCMYGLVGINNFGLTSIRVIHGYTRITHYLSWIESVVWPL